MGEKIIKVECTGQGTMSIDALTRLQDEMKFLSEENKQKLKQAIIRYGFSAPVFVWKTKGGKRTYIVDGHSRVDVLRELRDEGWRIPEIPVAYVHAKSRKEARTKLLMITSQYGQMDQLGFEHYVKDLHLEEFKDVLELPFIHLDLIGLLEPLNTDAIFPKNLDIEDVYQEPASTLFRCPECGYQAERRAFQGRVDEDIPQCD